VVNLKPRPTDWCGRKINRQWQKFEKTGLGTLGRIELCSQCHAKSKCAWPNQFGKSLKGAQVIFGTQAHLERSPNFLEQIALWVGSKNALVILDEANFIMKPFERRIVKEQLLVFLKVLEYENQQFPNKFNQRWAYLCGLLLAAPTSDLRSSDWHFPQFYHDWSLAIQMQGYNMHGDEFFFLAYDLIHFSRSPLESRERAPNGDIIFASAPTLSYDFIIYSGTAHQQFSEFRLGKEFASPFGEYSFFHPGTTWFNIASRLGMKTYFKKNSPQVLDFFASLVARRLSEGKRPLLIAKKSFCDFCARQMEERLQNMGVEVRIVTSDWSAEMLIDTGVIPLINYGMIGTNLFQEFDCAYCLTGYYVTEEAVDGILQDLVGSDMQIPLRISTEGKPCRRRAGVPNRRGRGSAS